MKILHILSTPRAEGTPNLVLDWLATEMHEQEVFVLNSQPADLTEKIRTMARWYGEGEYFSRGRSKFTGIADGVRRVCVERRPELVLCWPTGFANWVCLGARLGGVGNLLVHAGNPPNRGVKNDWMSRYGFWPLAALSAKVVCCSNYVSGEYGAIPLVSQRLFYSVWNCARVGEVADRAARTRNEQPPSEGRIAIMVATYERHKDHATLLEAVPKILRRLPDFRLKLAGEGSLREELELLAANLGITEVVEFLGMRRDIPELLGQADIFVFSTTPEEGLGSVLLEAMAASLPIVASDVPACREMLVAGEHGKLIPPKDSGALAEAVIHELEGRHDELFLTKSREFAKGFTAQRMMNEYLKIAKLE